MKRLDELREISNERCLTEKEYDEWYAIKKEQGAKIKPETCQVIFQYDDTVDEYGLTKHDRRYDELRGCIGRNFYAGNAGCGTYGWVSFRDIPEDIRAKLKAKRDAADREGWRRIREMQVDTEVVEHPDGTVSVKIDAEQLMDELDRTQKPTGEIPQ